MSADRPEPPPTLLATCFVLPTACLTADITLAAWAAYAIKKGIAFGSPSFNVSDNPVAALLLAFVPSTVASLAAFCAFSLQQHPAVRRPET